MWTVAPDQPELVLKVLVPKQRATRRAQRPRSGLVGEARALAGELQEPREAWTASLLRPREGSSLGLALPWWSRNSQVRLPPVELGGLGS